MCGDIFLEVYMLPPCVIGTTVIAPGVWIDSTCGEGNDCNLRTLEEHVYRGFIPHDGDWVFSTGGSKGCLAAQLICMIDNQGDVYPCSYFLTESAGNVMEQTFRDIWENSTLFQKLRDFEGYKGKCGSCEYLRVCGGCRARAEAVHGDYLAEEPYYGALGEVEEAIVVRDVLLSVIGEVPGVAWVYVSSDLTFNEY